jgi:hypothetical protein
MTTIRKIPTSQIDGDDSNNTSTSEIRPFGELAVYIDNENNGGADKLELLMFDGVRTHLRSKVLAKGTFYGGDADSADQGDGIENLDTIKLIPDAELHYNDGSYGNDQYIVIDPTLPNHIHVRAGGAIDASNALLFLGGEENNVGVNDSGGNVTIRTDNTNTWLFGSDGALTIPDAGIKGGPSGVNSVDLSWELILNSGKTIKIKPGSGGVVSPTFFGFDSDASGGGITLPAGGSIDDRLDGVIITGAGETRVNRFYAKVSNTLYQTVDAGITYQLINQAGTWSLDVVGDSNPRYTSTNLLTWTGGISPAPTGEVTIRATELTVGTDTWAFGGNGTLTLPTVGKIASNGNVKIASGDGLQIGSTTTIATDSSGGTGAGTAGVVDVPFGGTIINTYPAGSTITFDNGDVRTITSIVQVGSGGTAYLNINYSGSATASSPEFPITLETANYAAAYTPPEWSFGATGNLTLPGAVKSQSFAQLGQIITCMGLVNVPSQYKLFNSVTFTGGVYSDIQVGWAVSNGEGWTATVTAIDDPAPGFITIDDNWDDVDEKLVSFTSPDYQAATSEDLILTSDNSSLTLSANGNLTLPNSGGVIKSTASSTIINGAYKSFTISTGAFGPGPGYSGNGLWVAITPETEQIQAGWTCTFSNSPTVFTVTSAGYSADNFSINFDGQTDNVVFPMIANSPTSSIKLQPVEDGDTWTFDGDGSITFPDNTVQTTAWTGAIPAPANGDSTSGSAWMTFYADGALQSTSKVTINPATSMLTINGNIGTGGITFPDNTVQSTAYIPGSALSTVAKTGVILPTTTGPVETLNHDSVLTGLTNGTYGPFTLGVVTFSVVVSGGVINSTTGLSSGGDGTVGGAIGQMPDTFVGGPGGTTITWTVATVVQETPTAIDLTKSVNKLTDGVYTLADGTEGQIMYLVAQNGVVPANVSVLVANSRNIGVGTLSPFSVYDNSDDSYYDNIGGICTLIFTDGAWQQSGGAWGTPT